MSHAEHRGRAMGSDLHVIAVGASAPTAITRACEHLERLEARWSRFRPDSEVSRLNANRGVPVIVSADTRLLVERALRAAELTDGRYDPTLGDDLVALGYDRDFAEVRASHPAAAPRTPTRGLGVAGAAGIRVEPMLDAITLPSEVGFDPGGIGKGLAADLVVTAMLGDGVDGAMVNLGGDLRAEGVAPTDAGWIVGIEDPRDRSRTIATVTVHSGGVCTSSRLRRRWTAADGTELHHLLDPRTGAPVEHDIATVTVVAGEAWWAEALTKAVFVEGVLDPTRAARLLTNASALVVRTDGTLLELGRPGAFAVAAAAEPDDAAAGSD